MSTIGIGMIGSGYMALTYAEALARYVRGARLMAVAGGTRAPGLAASYGAAAAPSIEALLARSDVGAVIIVTPDQLHRDQALMAAAAGKHVLVEKPMAPSVAQCDEMIAACRQAGVQLAVVKTERYRRVTMRAKQLIDAGRIGPIHMLRTISCFPEALGREILESRPWYADPAGGGLFMSMASHNADMLLWLTGLRAQQVFAQASTFGASGVPAQSVMAQIVFERGVMGHMWISAEMPPPSLPSSEVRFQLVGAQGIIDFEDYEFLDLGAGDGWERLLTPERFDYMRDPTSPVRLEPHIGVLQGFIDGIHEARPPDVPGEAGRAAVAICEACVRSAAARQAVDVAPG
ncbi:MAG: Gfo/Idh/MocA family oxidoreductase [Kouleothrix sp.]|nr:Gfo/Idh/MocA family oxidoreductase [Kouleothrix sp.]